LSKTIELKQVITSKDSINKLPDLIIAGSPKTGTTSIFRYLSEHPEICPSTIKEIHFFLHYKEQIDDHAIKDYKSYFRHCDPLRHVRLEASPRYLIGGKPVARLIERYLPEARLIFILREPVSRYFSRYLSLRSKTDRIPTHLDLDRMVDLSIDNPNAIPNPKNPECSEEMVKFLWEGCYSVFLKEYIKLFPKERICIVFFDELSNKPINLIRRICEFAELAPSFYESYQFDVENRTRLVKYDRFHKFAEKVNRRFQKFFNRYPGIRKQVRSIYYDRINPDVGGKDKLITSYATKRLFNYYTTFNRDLKLLLNQKFPDMSMPEWLENDK
jgi:hypothetical protein